MTVWVKTHLVCICQCFKKYHFNLKGQCVGMEAVQLWWFHRLWNNNKTKGLHDFTAYALDSTHYTCSTWKTTKVYGRMEQRKHMYLILTKCFKQRKLWVDPSKNVWYVVELYGKRTKRNVGMCVDNGPPAVMHS